VTVIAFFSIYGRISVVLVIILLNLEYLELDGARMEDHPETEDELHRYS
jgi:hypothetical protein